MKVRVITIFIALCLVMPFASQSVFSRNKADDEIKETVEQWLLTGEELSRARTRLYDHEFTDDKVGKVFGREFNPEYIAVILDITRKGTDVKAIKISVNRRGEVNIDLWKTIEKDHEDFKVLTTTLRM